MDSSREGSVSSRGGDDRTKPRRPRRTRGFRISPKNEQKLTAALSEYEWVGGLQYALFQTLKFYNYVSLVEIWEKQRIMLFMLLHMLIIRILLHILVHILSNVVLSYLLSILSHTLISPCRYPYVSSYFAKIVCSFYCPVLFFVYSSLAWFIQYTLSICVLYYFASYFSPRKPIIHYCQRLFLEHLKCCINNKSYLDAGTPFSSLHFLCFSNKVKFLSNIDMCPDLKPHTEALPVHALVWKLYFTVRFWRRFCDERFYLQMLNLIIIIIKYSMSILVPNCSKRVG